MNSWIEISKTALHNNFDVFCSILGPSRFAPVLKSNAYGHGLKTVHDCLMEKAPQWLCVNYADEAAQLRQYGFRGQILIVGPCFQKDMELAQEVQAQLVLTSQDQFQDWLTLKDKPELHVKVDTGMRRQGFLSKEWDALAKKLSSHKPLIKAVCTHFANVEDVLEQEFAEQQLKQLTEAHHCFTNHGLNVSSHAAASAATLILPQSRLDLGRIGISLYGFWPSRETRLSYLQQNDQICPLLPTLTWKTKIAQLKSIAAGDYVGYGLTFRASHAMRIAVLPVGYNEGYPRVAGDHQSYVIVGSKRAPLVGRVCMNMMMVDVTHLEKVQYGDTVILLGKDKISSEEVTASQLATWSNTIHYESVTRLHPNIPRHVV